MRIHLAGNFEGYERARGLQRELADEHEVIWHGPPEYDENDDYPVLAIRVAKAVVDDEDAGRPSRGLVVGGDGAGETVAANKVNGARAVPGLTIEFIRAARIHADANVLIVPADLQSLPDTRSAVTVFLNQSFSCDLDDARRLVNTAEFETGGTIEGWLIEH